AVRRPQPARHRPLREGDRTLRDRAGAAARGGRLGPGGRRAMRAGAVLACAVVLSVAATAGAHVTATGLATITVAGTSIDYQLTIVVAELPGPAAALVNGAVEGEAASVDRLGASMRTRVAFRVGDARCR